MSRSGDLTCVLEGWTINVHLTKYGWSSGPPYCSMFVTKPFLILECKSQLVDLVRMEVCLLSHNKPGNDWLLHTLNEPHQKWKWTLVCFNRTKWGTLGFKFVSLATLVSPNLHHTRGAHGLQACELLLHQSWSDVPEHPQLYWLQRESWRKRCAVNLWWSGPWAPQMIYHQTRRTNAIMPPLLYTVGPPRWDSFKGGKVQVNPDPAGLCLPGFI